jgi:hypothetical protein
MDEARGKCHEATEWLKSSAFGEFLEILFVYLSVLKCLCCIILGIDDSSFEETPRTVFKALKKTVI